MTGTPACFIGCRIWALFGCIKKRGWRDCGDGGPLIRVLLTEEQRTGAAHRVAQSDTSGRRRP